MFTTRRNTIGTIKSVKNSEACRLSCFYNPFCKYYSFVGNISFCTLIRKNEWSNYYDQIANVLKSISGDANNTNTTEYAILNFSDEHVNIGDNEKAEIEALNEKYDLDYCNSLTRSSFFYGNICDGEIRGKYINIMEHVIYETLINITLEEIPNPYTIKNLMPETRYVVTVEVVNAFGKSNATSEPVFSK